MPKLIDAEKAKAAILALIEKQFNLQGKPHHWSQRVTAAIDSLPDASEGRWENAAAEIDDLRCKLFGEGDTAGEGALHAALSILDRWSSAPATAAQPEKGE